MRTHRSRAISILLIGLLLAEPASVLAQQAAPARSSWRADPPRIETRAGERPAPVLPFDSSATRSHTGMGRRWWAR